MAESFKEGSQAAAAIPALQVDDMLRIEATICRAELRPEFWLTNKSDADLIRAIGRMLKRFWEQRRQEVSQERIAEALNHLTIGDRQMNYRLLNRFMNGQAAAGELADWYEAARNALKIILFGTSTVDKNTRCVAERIISYYLPHPMPAVDGDWYFNSNYKSEQGPARPIEFATQLRALAQLVKGSNQHAEVIRLSGGRRFLQVQFKLMGQSRPENAQMEWELTDTGTATVDCLAEGVPAIFIYPNTSPNVTQAEKSAKAFKELAIRYADARYDGSAERLQTVESNICLVPLSPDSLGPDNSSSLDWSGEFLSKSFRWAYYRSYDEQEESATLIMVRRGKKPPVTFSHDDKETMGFRNWLEAFFETEPSGALARTVDGKVCLRCPKSQSSEAP